MNTATRRASESDLDRASAVLGDAFHDYPWTKWTVDSDDHQVRVTGLQRAALQFLGFPFGEVWVTEAEGKIHSVAVSQSSLVNIPQAAINSLLLVRRQLEGTRFDVSSAAGEVLKEWLPDEPYLFLGTMGTSLSMQGLGLGTMTLRSITSSGDSAQMPILLETSSEENVDFYRKFDFQVVRRWQMNNRGPNVWAMRRNPL